MAISASGIEGVLQQARAVAQGSAAPSRALDDLLRGGSQPRVSDLFAREADVVESTIDEISKAREALAAVAENAPKHGHDIPDGTRVLRDDLPPKEIIERLSQREPLVELMAGLEERLAEPMHEAAAKMLGRKAITVEHPRLGKVELSHNIQVGRPDGYTHGTPEFISAVQEILETKGGTLIQINTPDDRMLLLHNQGDVLEPVSRQTLFGTKPVYPQVTLHERSISRIHTPSESWVGPGRSDSQQRYGMDWGSSNPESPGQWESLELGVEYGGESARANAQLSAVDELGTQLEQRRSVAQDGRRTALQLERVQQAAGGSSEHQLTGAHLVTTLDGEQLLAARAPASATPLFDAGDDLAGAWLASRNLDAEHTLAIVQAENGLHFLTALERPSGALLTASEGEEILRTGLVDDLHDDVRAVVAGDKAAVPRVATAAEKELQAARAVARARNEIVGPVQRASVALEASLDPLTKFHMSSYPDKDDVKFIASINNSLLRAHEELLKVRGDRRLPHYTREKLDFLLVRLAALTDRTSDWQPSKVETVTQRREVQAMRSDLAALINQI